MDFLVMDILRCWLNSWLLRLRAWEIAVQINSTLAIQSKLWRWSFQELI